MTALDTEYSNDFARIEAYSTVAIDSIASPEAMQRSQRLYALLAGLVRGRGLQIIQRVPSQNGYEALRQLMQLFQPTSRTRSLGILTALTQVHSFKSSEPLLAQLLELERMCDEYEKASSKSLDDDFKTSILLKCITGPMKSHLATILTEHATYAEIREAALRYERMQQKWTPASLFSHEFGGSRGSRDEPTPMEVDRVGKGLKGKDPKGKGKGSKGKDGKGKGKWNNNSKGKPGMIHVDDSLMLLPLDWALKRFIPVVQQKFQITYEVARAPGDSFRFLQRLHSITEQGITIRQPASYIQQMQTIMNVKQNSRQRVPCWPELRNKDNTPELSIEEASKFRQAIGTALYISCDRPDVGFTVRLLAAYMSRPTEHAKTGLVKLIQYLINTCHYGICMKYAKPGTRKLHDYVADHGCSDSDDRFSLEVYSDADWSGSKKDRKSYGGASYCLNGQYIHYICRSQKSVSLSSMESEYYSAVGASCQGIFMKAVIEFMSRSPCDLTVYVDNQHVKPSACVRV